MAYQPESTTKMETVHTHGDDLQAKLARLEALEKKEAKQKEHQKRLAAKNAIILRKAKEKGITASKEEIDAYLAA